jgi:hypothetical protein
VSTNNTARPPAEHSRPVGEADVPHPGFFPPVDDPASHALSLEAAARLIESSYRDVTSVTERDPAETWINAALPSLSDGPGDLFGSRSSASEWQEGSLGDRSDVTPGSVTSPSEIVTILTSHVFRSWDDLACPIIQAMFFVSTGQRDAQVAVFDGLRPLSSIELWDKLNSGRQVSYWDSDFTIEQRR